MTFRTIRFADCAYDMLPDGRRSGITETVWENGTAEVSRTDLVIRRFEPP